MTERVKADLRISFEEVCTRYGATLEAFETDRGHAHLEVSYPPKIALSTLIMSLKTISSMRVRKHRWEEIDQALMGDAFWSPSYAVASYGEDPLDVVSKYIRAEQAPSRGRGRRPRSQG